MVINVQEALDSILPSMLSLIAVFVMSRLLKKGVKPLTIMLCCLVLGVVCSFLGIL